MRPSEAEIVAVIAPELNQPDAVDAVEQIAGRPMRGYRTTTRSSAHDAELCGCSPPAGRRVLADDADPRPAQSALAAMHRSVGFEFGDQTFGSLDLPTGGVDEQSAAVVIDALLGDAGVMAVARQHR